MVIGRKRLLYGRQAGALIYRMQWLNTLASL